MELHQLRYFLAVVDCGGFGKAAEKCSVAQPSLSQQIKKLEGELGCRLFDRLGRRVVLTEFGHSLLPRARRILEEVQMIERERDQEGSGQISIGFIATLAPFLLTESLRRLRQNFPGVDWKLEEGFTEQLVDELVQGQLDLAFASLPLDEKRLDYEVLAEEPLVVLLPEGNPLTRWATLRLEQLESQPFVALHQEHCLGQQVSDYCYGHRLYPNIVCRTHQFDTLSRCVRAGVGLSLVPQMMVAELGAGLTSRSLEDQPPARPVVAAWHRFRRPSRLSRAVMETVRAILREKLDVRTKPKG